MKKLLTVIMLIASVIACCSAAVAHAQTSEEYVCELATQHEKVKAAECVIYKRACVIAIKTEKFTTKTEYDEYVNNLADQIKTDCEVDYVYVSRSPKLMSKLAELNKLDEDDRAKAIEELIHKQMENNGSKPIMPRFLDE